MRTGLEVLVDSGLAPIRGASVGLLVHPASVNRRLEHAVDLLRRAGGVRLARLFGPQHGLRGETQDNMVEWRGFTESGTGLPVCSLYGEVRKPTPEMLDSLDALVVDLQDVGARCYTFTWTMLLCLEACAECDVRVVVLDRPNPIGAAEREGFVLEPAYRSFVGMAPIPMRHSLTLGELAALFNGTLDLGAQLEVVWMDGYDRSMSFENTDLPWVLPSPNMPTLETARVYPGMCLLEGTNLSEGRGATRPFEMFGAPFIEPERLVERLGAYDLPGIAFRPCHFEPTFQKWAGELCGGAQIHVTDHDAFRPVRTGVAVLAAVRELWPDAFAWRAPPYEYETQILPIDMLAGTDRLRTMIDAGVPPDEVAASWEADLDAFGDSVREFLYYD